MASSVAEEMKVVPRLERLLVEYDLSLLYEVIDIKEGIKEVREIVEKYEELHITLRQELGGHSYEESYPEYKDKIQCVTDWIRKAKSAIKEKKEEKFFAEKLVKEMELMEKEKSLLRAEEKYFGGRGRAGGGGLKHSLKEV